MTQSYRTILVAVDGSKEAELALHKAIHVARRNQARLIIAHVIDTRALHNVATFDASIYETLEQEAQLLLKEYQTKALQTGLSNVQIVLEFGNPKTLLAHDIPKETGADLMLLGATGLNTFERLLIGSSSEYILRHTSIDLLVVRDKDKTM
ncbi:universal stress protein UspA [Streptococcus azizii]|uniref:Universal stress protein n=1 Tax=Streptococcus azizii TaxID=1579424 RepID=A0AB36JJQ5_9STRE|nr:MULTISPECIES: universal stress protein [Streptococcus]MBF0776971.1 universal stress protein [Streptococcus sp. 19428wD3_AN2]ONK25470.1 universal stress protein UspA [Streptococcus azizii]ONK25685.1 universal stress protein UspA [Streptococcus azizii]ONK25843.1 universal stress protein UspA [Streptococcus azizii]TFU82015.1 universal stress protein [Streptococcus sp. AN2]